MFLKKINIKPIYDKWISINKEEKVFDDTDIEILSSIVDYIKTEDKRTGYFKTEHLDFFEKTFSWPLGKLCPLLDLLRYLIIDSDVVNLYIQRYEENNILERLLEIYAQPATDKLSIGSKMMIMRFFQNLFKHKEAHKMLFENCEIILATININNISDENTKAAYYGILLNYSLIFSQFKFCDAKERYIESLFNSLTTEKNFDHIYRMLVSLGTILTRDKLAYLTFNHRLQTCINEIPPSPPAHVGECINELKQIHTLW